MKHIKNILLLSLLISISVFELSAQNYTDFLLNKFSNEKERAVAVLQNNEFQNGGNILRPAAFCNPLLLNGDYINFGKFSLFTKGILTVLEGDNCNKVSTPILFKIHIRRRASMADDGNIIYSSESVRQIEISDILSNAKIGDDLIIEPVEHQHWQSKRVLKLLEPLDDC